MLIELGRSNVFGTGSLRTLAFVERDLLTFVKLVKGRALNILGVKEQILRARRLDEAEAFVCQLFDCAFGHYCVSAYV